MNKFAEMIQKGEELIAKTNEILVNELDLDGAGTVAIATYLTDLKDIHKDSLEFTNPDIVSDFEQYREGLSNEEYMDYLTRFLMIRNTIEGELRDRLYDKTAKFDIALRNNIEKNNNYYRQIVDLTDDIAAIREDIVSIDKTLSIMANNSNTESAAFELKNFKQTLLDRIARKEVEIEEIKEIQKALLYGAHTNNMTHGLNQENDRTVESVPVEGETLTNEEDIPVPLPELPTETDVPGSDNDVIVDETENIVPADGNEEDLVPVFPELPTESEILPELPEEEVLPELPEEDVLPELPEEDVLPELPDEDVLPELPEEDVLPELSDEDVLPELPDEEEVIPDEDDEIEVVQHTEAKPSLLKKIGNIIFKGVLFLAGLAGIQHASDHFINHHDVEPSLEQESQMDDNLDDEDNLIDNPDDVQPENTTPDNTIPDNTIHENTTPENTTPENTTPENTTPENTTPETTAEFPVELGVGEVIYDTQTGVEVTHDGTTYLNTSEGVSHVVDNQDLTKTDHETTVVNQQNMEFDLNPTVTTTGNEQTYDEAIKDMTAEEISELDAAIAQFASEFDSSYTLKP